MLKVVQGWCHKKVSRLSHTIDRCLLLTGPFCTWPSRSCEKLSCPQTPNVYDPQWSLLLTEQSTKTNHDVNSNIGSTHCLVGWGRIDLVSELRTVYSYILRTMHGVIYLVYDTARAQHDPTRTAASSPDSWTVQNTKHIMFIVTVL